MPTVPPGQILITPNMVQNTPYHQAWYIWRMNSQAARPLSCSSKTICPDAGHSRHNPAETEILPDQQLLRIPIDGRMDPLAALCLSGI
jgi:hypothetical protein